MTLKLEEINWEGLFSQSADDEDLANFAGLQPAKSILITGAGGSIGGALARAIATLGPSQLILVDSSEQNLYTIHKYLSSQSTDHISLLGSVVDQRCMRDLFVRFRPQVVYHSAALKHVPLGEMNPFAVAENNIFGTEMVADLAQELRVERLVMISADKSALPESIMGASKRLAEMLLQARTNVESRMTSIRLGNILGSEGSVVPLFLEQIARGGPVTVTDPQVERYFLTMDSTVLRVLVSAADCPAGPAIAIPIMGKAIKIADLARYLIEQTSSKDVQVTYTGLRPGDKLREDFMVPGESVSHQAGNLLQWLSGPYATVLHLAQGLAELRTAVERCDLPRLLAALTELVPEYHPSEYLREPVGAAVS